MLQTFFDVYYVFVLTFFLSSPMMLMVFSCDHFAHFNPSRCVGCRFIHYQRNPPPWQVAKSGFIVGAHADIQYFVFFLVVQIQYILTTNLELVEK